MDQLARLFGSLARLKLLRLFVFNKEEILTLEDIATRTKLPRAVVRTELAQLTTLGLIKRKAGKTVRYSANQKFPHFDALDIFIRQTTEIGPENIVNVFKKAGSLRLVALSGFFTGAEEPQIDLLVVGDALQEGALARGVASLEAELGREIRYASFSTADFRYRLGIYDRLVRDLLDYPHRLILDKIGLQNTTSR